MAYLEEGLVNKPLSRGHCRVVVPDGILAVPGSGDRGRGGAEVLLVPLLGQKSGGGIDLGRDEENQEQR